MPGEKTCLAELAVRCHTVGDHHRNRRDAVNLHPVGCGKDRLLRHRRRWQEEHDEETQEKAHGFSSKRAQPSHRRDEEKRGKPAHYSANSSGIWFVKAYRHGRLPALVVVWSHAGAQFFHNLQIPAGFLQRASRVLFMTIVIAGGTGFLRPARPR